MRERLAVAISTAALLVALLGTTSLGEAARDAGAKIAEKATGQKASARGPRGPRGRRGYRGARGPRGFLGAPGEKGDPGLSNAYEYKSANQTAVTGSTPETATTVAAPQTALPAGKYVVTAQVLLEGTGGRTYCRGRGPGVTGPYLGQSASATPSSGPATLALTFAVELAADGTINVACWQISGSGALAGPVDLVVVKVGDLTALN